MPMQLHLQLTLVLLAAASSAATSLPMQGCQSRCGEVDVPYPFGIGDGCYREGFGLVCNTTFNPPKLLSGNIEISEVRLLQGQLRAKVPIARDCYNQSGIKLNTGIMSADLSESPFTFSADNNTFTVTGCDTLVYMNDPTVFATGCVAVCSKSTPMRNNTCSGVGCCETAIPVGLKYYQAEFRTFNNHTLVWSFNPCSYAFIVEKGGFVFNTSFLSADYTYEDVQMPVVMDWSMENHTCETARDNRTAYACRSKNSKCIESNNGKGYLCNCSSGYRGNPYLEDGCQDIDECKEPRLYPCNGNCTNVPGDYLCNCTTGTYGDAKKGQCIREPTGTAVVGIPFAIKLVIGLGSSLLFILLISSWIYWALQKRKLIKLKQEFFEQNGGLYLQQYISSYQTNGRGETNEAKSFKIYALTELERATQDFDKSQILGRGGQGIVYRGKLDNDKDIAVKKSMMISESSSKEFASEMFILSQINHVNVVKLLGCCLDVEVPMLVYEYMSKGTLFELIHEKQLESPIPWSVRLRMAVEAAKALAYLHSEASPPILHGDIKSSNILLDDNHIAKVSDFGTSTLAPKDKAQLMTLVQGTWGYLDPEYMQTNELTEKSDVYSFGVVLAELLTGQKAITEEGKSLASNFISCMNNNRLLEILDSHIVSEGSLEQFQMVADLVVQCLNLKGNDRPDMTQIYMELDGLRRLERHPWVHSNFEERESLLGEQPCSSDTTCVFSSANGAFDVEAGR